MGRYSNGGAAYDRSVYLDLYNCKYNYRRDIKNELNKKRLKISNPRFNLCLLGHPQTFIKSIRDEAENRSDGLMQRFLTSCPEPSYFLFDDTELALSKPRLMSMTVFLYVIKIFHTQILDEKPILRKYRLDPEARILYGKLHDEYKMMTKMLSKSNVFISCMYAKADTHLIRLSAIHNCLENMFKVISNLEFSNKLVLSKELDERINDAFSKQPSDIFISAENVKKAKELLDYFILTRLILAGFTCKMNFDSNEKNLASLIKLVETKKEMNMDCKLTRIIIMMPGKEVECLDVINEKKFKQSEVLRVFKLLHDKKIGVFEEKKSCRGQSKKIFIKKFFDSSVIDEEFIMNLECFGIDVKTYIEQYEKGIFQ